MQQRANEFINATPEDQATQINNIMENSTA